MIKNGGEKNEEEKHKYWSGDGYHWADMCNIGSAAAANYIWVESNVTGVGHLGIGADADIDTEDLDVFYFYQDSMVEGTGLVMVDKDISLMPWDPAQNLETNLHIHGCGDYEVDQKLKAVIVRNYYTPSGAWNRNVSQSITYCEDAEMTFKPVALTSGSMTLIDDDTSIKWKEDLCIKNNLIAH